MHTAQSRLKKVLFIEWTIGHFYFHFYDSSQLWIGYYKTLLETDFLYETSYNPIVPGTMGFPDCIASKREIPGI